MSSVRTFLAVMTAGFLGSASLAETVIDLVPQPIDPNAIARRDHDLLVPQALPATQSELPASAKSAAPSGQPAYEARLTYAGRQISIFAVEKDGKYVYFGREGTGKPVMASDSSPIASATYVPLEIPIDGGKATFCVQAGPGPEPKWIRYFVPTVHVGQWDSPKGPINVAVYDLDYDGKFDEPIATKLAIDIDRDGELDLSRQSLEVVVLGSPYEIASTTFVPVVTADGSQLKLTDTDESALALEPVAVGSPAPNFRVEDFTGKEISLEDYRGKFVFVDVWATWCGPCRGEIPNIQAAAKKYKDADLVVAGISIDDDRDTAADFVDDQGLEYTHLWSEGGWKSPICQQYQIHGIPFTMLIDPEGTLVAVNIRGPRIDQTLSWVPKYKTEEGKEYFASQLKREALTSKLTALQRSGQFREALAMVNDELSNGKLDKELTEQLKRAKRMMEFELEID